MSPELWSHRTLDLGRTFEDERIDDTSHRIFTLDAPDSRDAGHGSTFVVVWGAVAPPIVGSSGGLRQRRKVSRQQSSLRPSDGR